MTPSLSGLIATMLPGVRPSIRLAAEPTATTLSALLSMATTEGSESTIPCPLTNTRVFAVPRSIATSRPKSPPNIPAPSLSDRSAPLSRRLENTVLLHTKVPVAQDHVIQDLDPDYFGGLPEPPGDLAILVARPNPSARVVVGEDHTGRAGPDRRLENLPGMDQRRGKGAERDRRELQNLILRVQEHGDEVLPIKVSDAPPQKTVNVLGGGYHGPSGVANTSQPLPEFHRSKYYAGFSLAYPVQFYEIVDADVSSDSQRYFPAPMIPVASIPPSGSITSLRRSMLYIRWRSSGSSSCSFWGIRPT